MRKMIILNDYQDMFLASSCSLLATIQFTAPASSLKNFFLVSDCRILVILSFAGHKPLAFCSHFFFAWLVLVTAAKGN